MSSLFGGVCFGRGAGGGGRGCWGVEDLVRRSRGEDSEKWGVGGGGGGIESFKVIGLVAP